MPSMEMVTGRLGRERRQRGSVSEVVLLAAVAFECLVAGTWEAGRCCCRVAVVVVCAEGVPASKVKPESDFPVSGREGSLTNQSSKSGPVELGLVLVGSVGSGVSFVDGKTLGNLDDSLADVGQLGLVLVGSGVLIVDGKSSWNFDDLPADVGQLGLGLMPGDTGILSDDLECSWADLGISSRSIG